MNNLEINGDVIINITSSLEANITIDIIKNNCILAQFFSYLSTEHIVAWETNNGSFPDGVYEINVEGFNAENESETSLTASVDNIHLDNTEPEITSVAITNIARLQHIVMKQGRW